MNEESFNRDKGDQEWAGVCEQILLYLRNRAQPELYTKLIEKVRERVLLLSADEFKKQTEMEEGEDLMPTEELWAYLSHSLDRPIINRDACPEEFQSYVIAHECAEYIELVPYLQVGKHESRDDKTMSRQITGGRAAHEIGIRAEYTEAKGDTKLEKYHTYISMMIRRWIELARQKPANAKGRITKLDEELALRQRVFEEIMRSD